MDDQQNSGQNKSIVDRGNDAINQARQLRGAVNNIKRARDFAQGLRTGAQAAQGAASAVSGAGGTAAGAGGAAGTAAAGAAAGGAASAAGTAASAAAGAAVGAAGTAAAGAAGASITGGVIATSPVWGTGAAIIGAAVLIAVLFVLIFGGGKTLGTEGTTGPVDCVADLGGTCQATGSTCASSYEPDTTGATCSDTTTPLCCVPTAPSGTTYSCPSGDYVACLRTDFNIVVTGAATTKLKKMIYNAYAYLGKSSLYISLLTHGSTFTIRDVPGSGCHGFATSASVLTLYDDGSCDNLPQTALTYFFAHEGSHIVASRNPRLFQAFPYSSLSQSDSSCFQYSACGNKSGYFLKSYPLRYACSGWGSGCIGGITSKSESFAEAAADYLTPNSYWRTGWGGLCAISINNFKTTCNNTFDWLKINVFGGYTYY